MVTFMFNNIKKSDILFKTLNISVLKPHIKKGVLVFHKIHNDETTLDNIKKNGLKKDDIGHSIYRNCMFFKAPVSSPKEINYSSINSELNEVYPDLFDSDTIMDTPLHNIVVIRIDPRDTYVFSSPIRTHYYGEDIKRMLNQSRISLCDYFKIIEKNGIPVYKNPQWHLISRKMYYFPDHFQIPTIFSADPIEQNSEIIVECDIILPEHFVAII